MLDQPKSMKYPKRANTKQTRYHAQLDGLRLFVDSDDGFHTPVFRKNDGFGNGVICEITTINGHSSFSRNNVIR